MTHDKKKKKFVFSPILLKIQRKQKLNDDLKDSERATPGMTKQVQNLIETLTEEKLKKNANRSVDIYLEEAKGEGEFDFLKDEVDEEEARSLRNDRAKFKRSQKS
jgi:hypothetical protein